MDNIATYTDQEIVNAILNRDTFITKEFLYKKCYPLFKAIFDNYYTDCSDVIEFITEIYTYILYPHRETHKSKLEGFDFKCSLPQWLKIVTRNYCRYVYSRRIVLDSDIDVNDGRNLPSDDSLLSETKSLDTDDLRKVLLSMPNERYRELIRLSYLQEKSNEETASILGLSMPNYYNTHKRAKGQFCEALRKEGLL